LHYLDWRYWYDIVFSDKAFFISVALVIMALGFWFLNRK
jgi:hypothetical protein